jgi:prepilin-type N-terminal cleavage/methylation domain-containing protein
VTLIEMLIVLVILGIMLGVALPKFNQLRTNMRVSTAAQQLLGDLRRARSEALKRNASVGLQKTGSTTYNLQYIGARALPTGVQFTAGSDSVRFGSFGPPSAGAASFTVGFSGVTKQVTVSSAGLLAVR